MAKSKHEHRGCRELQHIEPLSVFQPPCRNAAYS